MDIIDAERSEPPHPLCADDTSPDDAKFQRLLRYVTTHQSAFFSYAKDKRSVRLKPVPWPRGAEESLMFPYLVRVYLVAPVTREWRIYLHRNLSPLNQYELLLYRLAVYLRQSYIERYMAIHLDDTKTYNVALPELVTELRRQELDQLHNYAPIRYLWRHSSIKIQMYLVAATRDLSHADKYRLLKFLSPTSKEMRYIISESKKCFEAFAEVAKKLSESNDALGVGMNLPQSNFLHPLKLLEEQSLNTTRHDWYAYLYSRDCLKANAGVDYVNFCLNYREVFCTDDEKTCRAALLPSKLALGNVDAEGVYQFHVEIGYDTILASEKRKSDSNVVFSALSYFKHVFGSSSSGIAAQVMFAMGYKLDLPLPAGRGHAHLPSPLQSMVARATSEPDAVSQLNSFPFLADYLLEKAAVKKAGAIFKKRLASLLKPNSGAINSDDFYDFIYYNQVTPFHVLPKRLGQQLQTNLDSFIATAASINISTSQSQYFYDTLTKRDLFQVGCIVDYMLKSDKKADADKEFNALAAMNFVRPRRCLFQAPQIWQGQLSVVLLPSGKIHSCVDGPINLKPEADGVSRNAKPIKLPNADETKGYSERRGCKRSSRSPTRLCDEEGELTVSDARLAAAILDMSIDQPDDYLFQSKATSTEDTADVLAGSLSRDFNDDFDSLMVDAEALETDILSSADHVEDKVLALSSPQSGAYKYSRFPNFSPLFENHTSMPHMSLFFKRSFVPSVTSYVPTSPTFVVCIGIAILVLASALVFKVGRKGSR